MSFYYIGYATFKTAKLTKNGEIRVLQGQFFKFYEFQISDTNIKVAIDFGQTALKQVQN